jgi:hypothetical protein
LLNSEDEGTIIICNVGNCVPTNMVLHPKRLESL